MVRFVYMVMVTWEKRRTVKMCTCIKDGNTRYFSLKMEWKISYFTFVDYPYKLLMETKGFPVDYRVNFMRESVYETTKIQSFFILLILCEESNIIDPNFTYHWTKIGIFAKNSF